MIRFGVEFGLDGNVGLGGERQARVEAHVARSFAEVVQGDGLPFFHAVFEDEAVADVVAWRDGVLDVDVRVFAEAHDLPAAFAHDAVQPQLTDAVAVAEEVGVAGVVGVAVRLLPFGDEQGFAFNPGVGGAVEFGAAAVLPVGELVAVA